MIGLNSTFSQTFFLNMQFILGPDMPVICMQGDLAQVWVHLIFSKQNVMSMFNVVTEPELGHTCPHHALFQSKLNQIDHNWHAPYAGPMVELDGTSRVPDFFVPYVFFIILASILTPLAGLGYLVWEGRGNLGVSTLGVYVLCLIVQVASESVSLRLGESSCCNIHDECFTVSLNLCRLCTSVVQIASGSVSHRLGEPSCCNTHDGCFIVSHNLCRLCTRVVQIASESFSLRLGEPSCSNTYNDTVYPPDPGHPGARGWGGGGNVVLCVDHVQGVQRLAKFDSVWHSCFGTDLLPHLLHLMWLSTYCGNIIQSKAFG